MQTNLTGVSQTLLLPLIGRAVASKFKHPLLYDSEALQIVERFKLETAPLLKHYSGVYAKQFLDRAYQIEQQVKEFINKNPDVVIGNLGAGLDTTFYRINNTHIKWVDIDLPDVIKLRKDLLMLNPQVYPIACSVLDESWVKHVKKLSGKYFFIAARLLFYFTEDEVQQIFSLICNNFPQSPIIFDTISAKQRNKSNKMFAKIAMHNVTQKWVAETDDQLYRVLPHNYNLTRLLFFII